MTLYHAPILEVILYILFASLCVIVQRTGYAKIISIVATISICILSTFVLCNLLGENSYIIGGWNNHIGIEYKINLMKQKIIMAMNLVLLYFLLFHDHIIQKNILNSLKLNKDRLFYSILLLAQAGYIGIILTNDLFNLYVFIEISSLSTYAIIAQGLSRKRFVGAIDYLILGTIGASFILIAIGFFYANTGTLNIDEIFRLLSTEYKDHQYSITIPFILLIIGLLSKIAFFPLHFWMVRAYLYTEKILLIYITPISLSVGFYLLHLFITKANLLHAINIKINNIIALLSIIATLFGSSIALSSNHILKIIIYSGISQIGLLTLSTVLQYDQQILCTLLFSEMINKIALFTMVYHINEQHYDFLLHKMPNITNSLYFKICVFFSLIFSAGLPLNTMFLSKISILSQLFQGQHYVIFTILILNTILTISYHIRLIMKLVFNCYSSESSIHIESNMKTFIILVITQFSLIYLII